MAENNLHHHHPPQPQALEIEKQQEGKDTRKRKCLFVVGAILLFLLLLFVVALILGLTVFKVREPRTQLVSASVEGIAPRISFPIVRIELNISFNLEIMVENRNHASFKHGLGKSALLYNGHQVGEADVYPGLIPAMRSTTIPVRLAIEVDELASEMTSLIRDVLDGELALETRTRIPGKIKFLGIFRKHAVTISECQLTIGIPDMKVRRQDCKNKTKL